MVAAEKVARFRIRGRLGELQCVCKEAGEAVSMAIVDVVDLARKSIKNKRKGATLSDRITDI